MTESSIAHDRVGCAKANAHKDALSHMKASAHEGQLQTRPAGHDRDALLLATEPVRTAGMRTRLGGAHGRGAATAL